MESLNIVVTRTGKDIVTIAPIGAIDTETYIILERKLEPILHESPKVVIFDMKDVVYISSLGIGVILKTKNMLEQGGGIALLTHLQPQIKKVLDIVKAIPNSNIFASREELDHYLATMQRKEMGKK